MEFGPKGAHSGIDYQKFFNTYKKMLIDGMYEGTCHLQQAMDKANTIVFAGIPTTETANANADSSDLDLGVEDLSIGEDADDAEYQITDANE
jgi:hypothetical protein